MPVKNRASASSSKFIRLSTKVVTKKNTHSTAARTPKSVSGAVIFVPSFQNIASTHIKKWKIVIKSISFQDLIAGLSLTREKNQLARNFS